MTQSVRCDQADRSIFFFFFRRAAFFRRRRRRPFGHVRNETESNETKIGPFSWPRLIITDFLNANDPFFPYVFEIAAYGNFEVFSFLKPCIKLVWWVFIRLPASCLIKTAISMIRIKGETESSERLQPQSLGIWALKKGLLEFKPIHSSAKNVWHLTLQLEKCRRWVASAGLIAFNACGR